MVCVWSEIEVPWYGQPLEQHILLETCVHFHVAFTLELTVCMCASIPVPGIPKRGWGPLGQVSLLIPSLPDGLVRAWVHPYCGAQIELV